MIIEEFLLSDRVDSDRLKHAVSFVFNVAESAIAVMDPGAWAKQNPVSKIVCELSSSDHRPDTIPANATRFWVKVGLYTNDSKLAARYDRRRDLSVISRHLAQPIVAAATSVNPYEMELFDGSCWRYVAADPAALDSSDEYWIQRP